MDTPQEDPRFPKTKSVPEVREQIQEDILSFASVVDDEKLFFTDSVLNELCDIVVENFRCLEPCSKSATAREFVEEVERRAEDKMLKTDLVEGSHYAAMRQILREWEKPSFTPSPPER